MTNNVVISEVALSTPDFHRFRKLIYEKAGISLCDSKHTLVQSRLARRLRDLSIDNYSDYYKFLMDPVDGADELENFINSLTTNKTEFFRESHHFDFLRDKLFPQLVQRAARGGAKRLRIWSAACSTGQEPYTLALTAREYFRSFPDWDIRILASDIDTQVLQSASEGIYPAELLDDVPPQYRKRYFTRMTRDPDGPVQVVEELKQLITFRQINFIERQWPINTQFDVIFCRNVMIYFDQATRRDLVQRFIKYLKPDGHLIIGHSESLLGLAEQQFEIRGNTIYQLNGVQGDRPPAVAAAPAPVVAKEKPTSAPAEPPSQNVEKEPSQGRRSRRELKPKYSERVEAADVNELPLTSIIVGEYHAQEEPGVISTVLGSCIGACLYDEVMGIGGMNHFMLPESSRSEPMCASYGIHAMELLINEIMKLGGDRRRLKAKYFGGAKLFWGKLGSMDVGASNIAFVEKFLRTEQIPVVAKHVGGETGMRVRFLPHTGQAFISPLDKDACRQVETESSHRAVRSWSAGKSQPESPCLF